MKKLLLLVILTNLLNIGCATSTEGLTKDQIADRERARSARISFYSQVLSSIAVGLASTSSGQGLKK